MSTNLQDFSKKGDLVIPTWQSQRTTVQKSIL